MKCTNCKKELHGTFYYEPSFHGLCSKCHARFGKNYITKKEAQKADKK